MQVSPPKQAQSGGMVIDLFRSINLQIEQPFPDTELQQLANVLAQNNGIVQAVDLLQLYPQDMVNMGIPKSFIIPINQIINAVPPAPSTPKTVRMTSVASSDTDRTVRRQTLFSLVDDENMDQYQLKQMKSMMQNGLKDKTLSKAKAKQLRDVLKQARERLGDDAFADSVMDESPCPVVAPNVPMEFVDDDSEVKQEVPSNIPASGKQCEICQRDSHSDLGSCPQNTLECGHVFCTECLHGYIMKLVGQKKAVGIMCPTELCQQEVTVRDIQTLLTNDEFNDQYLPATFAAFIEQDSLVMACPNPKGCNAVISVEPVGNLQVPERIIDTDNDGKILSAKAWLHYREFRVRCRECACNFCADCKVVPYHLGFTCSQWQEYKNARQCRFCKTKLEVGNIAPDQPYPSLRDVCDDEECLAKRDLCCTHFKKCGCPCNGVRGEDEKNCLPCLKHDFPDEDMEEEFCGICFVESLSEAPCIQLGSCPHVFHFDCVKRKIAQGYPGARIDFAFTKCSLCKQRMEHSMLQALLSPWFALEDIVKQKAQQRLKYEGLEKDPEIVNPNGRYYNKPEEFALHAFLFYMCHKCKKPYFAGGYQCQEANVAFDPKELTCSACQPHHVSDCKVHGREWLVYKCKYCCNIAQWYCWNNSHFCTSCHKPGNWQSLTTMTTGKNKKRYWEYPQCLGLKTQMLPILRDRSISDDEKEKRMSKLLSSSSQCPLGKIHPPNGVEYGLGCSMCADQEAEAENMALAEKSKRENEVFQKRMEEFFSDKFKDGLTFEYNSDFDENGIFFFLGSVGKTQRWRNPADLGVVKVTCSGLGGNPPSASPSTIVGRTAVRCVTAPIRNAWFAIDFIDKSVKPTHYTLRHYSSWDTEALRNWRLEGSNDGVHWDTLSTHVNDEGLNKAGISKTWPLSVFAPYRIFRIIQTGKNSNNHEYLALSGFELYGILLNRVIQGGAAQLKALAMYTSIQDFDQQDLKYTSDFDENGLFYLLGTVGKTQGWRNPADLGLVVCSSSGLATNPPSTPASAIVGREIVRCVTSARSNSWFVIDLLKLKFQPTAYTLRHYNTWDTECVRDWTFDCSNDGVNWVCLYRHHRDPGLNGKGSTHTWILPLKPDKPYRLFRLLQYGPNSNDHHYLPCSGVEMYGVLHCGPPPPPVEALAHPSVPRYQQQPEVPQPQVPQPQVQQQAQPVSAQVGIPEQYLDDNKAPRQELVYQEDFDENGALFWLGTMGKKQQWENPAYIGLVNVTASGLAANPPSLPASTLAGRTTQRCVTNMVPNSWFCVDLMAHNIIPTHYSLRHYNSWDTECLRNWVLEGSTNGSMWITISEHVEDQALNGKGSTHTWPILLERAIPFRLFRIRQTGQNSNKHDMLSCSGFEIYGRLAGPTVTMNLQSPEVDQKLVPQKSIVLKYRTDFDTNGLMYWLGTQGFTRNWVNPTQLGAVQVTASSIGSKSLPPMSLVGRQTIRLVTQSQTNSYFMIRLLTCRMNPTEYSLKHYASFNLEAVRHWRLEGSVDGLTFVTLINHNNDQSLNTIGATATWELNSTNQSYSVFRILQTGPNSNNHDFLALSGFEIYGTVTFMDQRAQFQSVQNVPSVMPQQQIPQIQQQIPHQMVAPQLQMKSVRMMSAPQQGPVNKLSFSQAGNIASAANRFQQQIAPNHQRAGSFPQQAPQIPGLGNGVELYYSSDFDENGSMFFLGSYGKTRPWVNPSELGLVDIEASSLAVKPPSTPTSAVVGRTTVRCVTENKPNQWIIIDMKYFVMKPTSYTLKHYSSWDTEALRNWRFEGSNDKMNWEVLRTHQGDRALLKRGSTYTWTLNSISAYRFFRIFNFAKNSNGHHYLACSGLELYGSLMPVDAAKRNQPSPQPPQQFFGQPKAELKYQSDFDENGLFFHIGSDFKSTQWRNPAELGRVVVTCSSLAIKPPSAPTSAIVGRSTVRCVTAPMQNPWFAVDLKEFRLQPTAYTLRHYNSWDTESVRSWIFEGSNDGEHYICLREHINDTALNHRGATHTWTLDVKEPYRFFRIYMTDRNSNRNFFLACSGLELYGFLY